MGKNIKFVQGSKVSPLNVKVGMCGEHLLSSFLAKGEDGEKASVLLFWEDRAYHLFKCVKGEVIGDFSWMRLQ